VLLADESPEIFEIFTRHELGHSLNLNRMRWDLADFPFKGLVKCLQRPDTVGAHDFDYACLEKTNKNLPAELPIAKSMAGWCQIDLDNRDSFAAGLYCIVFHQLLNDEHKCRLTQLNEVLADYFMTESEAFYFDHDKDFSEKSSESKRQELLKLASWSCDAPEYNAESEDQNKGTHPLNRTRVNRIILAQPELKRLLGCEGATDSPVLSDLKQAVTPYKTASYCPLFLNDGK
jgi:hypothetical protein